MARIVLATFGSHGDLHPYLAMGRALHRRGHAVTVAAASAYRDRIDASGLAFHRLRPEIDLDDAESYRKVMDPWRGAEYLTRNVLMPAVEDAHEDLDAACAGADLLVSHVLVHAGRIVAERRRLRWVMPLLQPMAFFSAHDFPVVPPVQHLRHLRWTGPRVLGWLTDRMFWVSRHWGDPARELRVKLGLDRGPDPLREGLYSPHGNLALFPEAFGPAQPDWPSPTVRCGFPFLDEDVDGKGLAEDLSDYIDAGAPPVVFTLGSAAVKTAPWFENAAREAAGLDRAVVLTGRDAPTTRHGATLVARSAPYHALFARASVIVHSGGIGTTAQALRSGRPQVVVPFAHDQLDNADRVRRLGRGVVLSRRRAADPRALRAAVAAARALGPGDGRHLEQFGADGAEPAAVAIAAAAEGDQPSADRVGTAHPSG